MTATLLLFAYKFTRSGCCFFDTFWVLGPFIFQLGLLPHCPGICPSLMVTLQGILFVLLVFITAVSSPSYAQVYLPDMVAAHGTPNRSDLPLPCLSLS